MSDLARYAYVTLAIVGVVALLAVWVIVGPIEVSPFGRNAAGSAISDPVTQSVKEGDTVTVMHGGVSYEVQAIGVIAPDTTGKASAFLSVDGERTARIYVGNTQALPDGTLIQTQQVAGDEVTFLLWHTSSPPPSPPAPSSAAISDLLLTGDSRTYAIGGHDAAVLFLGGDKGAHPTAQFRVNGEAVRSLAPGDTAIAGDFALTLVDIATRAHGDQLAAFYLSARTGAAASACGVIDGQTPACRGASACCGGACSALPDCAGTADGPAGTCGIRQLYCCGGSLSLSACSTVTTCGDGVCDAGEGEICPPCDPSIGGCEKRACQPGSCPKDCGNDTPVCLADADCVQPACPGGIGCQVNLCDAGHCALHDTSGYTCDGKRACPVLECFTTPCSSYACRLGQCVLMDDPLVIA